MRKLYWIVPIIIGLALLVYFLSKNDTENADNQPVLTSVSKGEFIVEVQATGELRAKNSVKIRGPVRMREAGINNTTISRILPEGTVVSQGDWVASLDKSSISDKFDVANSEIEKVETQLEQIKYDTAIELSNIRDQLSDLKFDVSEKELLVEQSQFEARMIIQQAELSLDRIKRDFKQLVKNYSLKQKQARARVAEVLTTRRQLRKKLSTLQTISEQFEIKAPEDGMLIYITTWGGDKLGQGGQVSAWNPDVAELPDLSSMISKTYVNEVDISKIMVGQEVEIGVDAFPDKKLIGTVTKVANVGQQLRNQDAKVFEVIVQVNSRDSTLRPSMTTSNSILTRKLDDALFIPIEALMKDSVEYVIVSRGGKTLRQEVVLGLANENFMSIELGLDSTDEVFLFYNGETDKLPLIFLEEADKKSAQDNFNSMNRQYEQAMNEKAKQTKVFDGQTGESGSSFIIFN